ncbi:MAG: WhiB family transcriptional regulator [Streptosporangiales bacterium]
MTTRTVHLEHEMARGDGLFQLLSHLQPPDLGGHPACADADADVFFPVSELDTVSVAEALSYCMACPVIESCREFAVRTGQHGIWGGTTETHRANLRRQARHAVAESDESERESVGVAA